MRRLDSHLRQHFRHRVLTFAEPFGAAVPPHPSPRRAHPAAVVLGLQEGVGRRCCDVRQSLSRLRGESPVDLAQSLAKVPPAPPLNVDAIRGALYGCTTGTI